MEAIDINIQNIINSVNRIKEEILTLQTSINEVKNEVQLARIEVNHLGSIIQKQDKNSKNEKLKEIEKEIKTPFKIINYEKIKPYEKGSFDDYMLNTILPKMLKEQEESSKQAFEKLKAKGVIVEKSDTPEPSQEKTTTET